MAKYSIWVLIVYEREITIRFVFANRGDTMNEHSRSEWEVRCAFDSYCKRVIKNEAINAHRDAQRAQCREVSFSNLNEYEERQLYIYDSYFRGELSEQFFFVAGKEISAKLLLDALHSLPKEKRDAVLLYYFFDMTDEDISQLHNVSRSTVQHRRTSSFGLLKRYLEERHQ